MAEQGGIEMKSVGRLWAVLALGVILSGCATIRPPKNATKLERTLLTTGYCHCQKCSGWHRNWFLRPTFTEGPNRGKRKKVGITASGSKVRHGTIAADTSLYPFGSVMDVPGYGMGRVEDRGGAIKGQHIDLYFKRHKDALRWGRKRVKVTVWIPR